MRGRSLFEYLGVHVLHISCIIFKSTTSCSRWKIFFPILLTDRRDRNRCGRSSRVEKRIIKVSVPRFSTITTNDASLRWQKERSVLVAAGHEERVLRWPTLSSLIGERKKQGEGEGQEEEEEEEEKTTWREKRSR